MEASELIKALRLCGGKEGGCDECPFHKAEGEWCIDVLLNSAADALEQATSNKE